MEMSMIAVVVSKMENVELDDGGGVNKEKR